MGVELAFWHLEISRIVYVFPSIYWNHIFVQSQLKRSVFFNILLVHTTRWPLEVDNRRIVMLIHHYHINKSMCINFFYVKKTGSDFFFTCLYTETVSFQNISQLPNNPIKLIPEQFHFSFILQKLKYCTISFYALVEYYVEVWTDIRTYICYIHYLIVRLRSKQKLYHLMCHLTLGAFHILKILLTSVVYFKEMTECIIHRMLNQAL